MEVNLKLYRRDDSAVWYAEFYTPDGRRVKRSTKTTDKQAAERLGKQWERDSAEGDKLATNHATLGDAFALMLDHCDERINSRPPTMKPSTKVFYTERIAALKAHFGASRPLKSIHLDDTLQYISKRRKAGVSDYTLHKDLTTLRVCFRLARQRRLWTGDLDEVLPVNFTTGYQPRERFLTRLELNRLLSSIARHRAAHLAFIVATGARWGESENASRADVDITGPVPLVTLRGTKTRKAWRTVPIVAPWGQELLAFALEHAPEPKGSGLLFARWVNPQAHIRAACERARIDPCSPNDLRRTALTWLSNDRVSNEMIARFAGHTDTTMADRVYVKHTPQSLLERIKGEMTGGGGAQPKGETLLQLSPALDGRQRKRDPTHTMRSQDIQTCNPNSETTVGQNGLNSGEKNDGSGGSK